MPHRPLVLASASPARRALLRAAGLAPEVVVSGVDEDGVDGLDPVATATALAHRKASAVADRLRADDGRDPGSGAVGDGRGHRSGAVGDGRGHRRGAVVVGCDSVLAFGDEVRGKPASADEAAAWWRGYRGRQGTLVTGHTVIDVGTGAEASAAAETVVRFGDPADDEIAAYVATGEPLGVAGGFTLDGYGAAFVDGIDGDHGTVLGLSLPLLRRLLAELGIAVTDLWAAP